MGSSRESSGQVDRSMMRPPPSALGLSARVPADRGCPAILVRQPAASPLTTAPAAAVLAPRGVREPVEFDLVVHGSFGDPRRRAASFLHPTAPLQRPTMSWRSASLSEGLLRGGTRGAGPVGRSAAKAPRVPGRPARWPRPRPAAPLARRRCGAPVRCLAPMAAQGAEASGVKLMDRASSLRQLRSEVAGQDHDVVVAFAQGGSAAPRR